METQAFQKIYTKIDQITKATITLHATGVGNEEIALVNDRLAQVVKIIGDEVTLQVFGGTEGIPTNAEVIFFGRSANLKVGEIRGIRESPQEGTHSPSLHPHSNVGLRPKYEHRQQAHRQVDGYFDPLG